MSGQRIGQYSVPTKTQLSSFTIFNEGTVTMTPASEAETFQNRIGMYTATTEEKGDFYLMWIEYMPVFLSDGALDGNGNEEGATWCNHLKDQINPTWRLLW